MAPKDRCYSPVSARNCTTAVERMNACENTTLYREFSLGYVCPEPVLVKCSYLVKMVPKKGKLRSFSLPAATSPC